MSRKRRKHKEQEGEKMKGDKKLNGEEEEETEEEKLRGEKKMK